MLNLQKHFLQLFKNQGHPKKANHKRIYKAKQNLSHNAGRPACVLIQATHWVILGKLSTAFIQVSLHLQKQVVVLS